MCDQTKLRLTYAGRIFSVHFLNIFFQPCNQHFRLRHNKGFRERKKKYRKFETNFPYKFQNNFPAHLRKKISANLRKIFLQTSNFYCEMVTIFTESLRQIFLQIETNCGNQRIFRSSMFCLVMLESLLISK